MLIIQLTETAEHPVSLASAWRQVTGDTTSSDKEAMRLAIYDKTWFRRKFGMGLVAALDAYGLGLMDFVQRLVTHLDAPSRDSQGRIRKDPDTQQTIPDYNVQRRALSMYQKLLQLGGAVGAIEPPTPPQRAPNAGEGEHAAAMQFRNELRNKLVDAEAEEV